MSLIQEEMNIPQTHRIGGRDVKFSMLSIEDGFCYLQGLALDEYRRKADLIASKYTDEDKRVRFITESIENEPIGDELNILASKEAQKIPVIINILHKGAVDAGDKISRDSMAKLVGISEMGAAVEIALWIIGIKTKKEKPQGGQRAAPQGKKRQHGK